MKTLQIEADIVRCPGRPSIVAAGRPLGYCMGFTGHAPCSHYQFAADGMRPRAFHQHGAWTCENYEPAPTPKD
jgi:hypothetical protein